MTHTHDWRCAAILLARREGAPPAVWNSLTHEEQEAFESALHPRPSMMAQFGVWVRRMMATKRGSACPTCGRP
jgi:hypothetical protein